MLMIVTQTAQTLTITISSWLEQFKKTNEYVSKECSFVIALIQELKQWFLNMAFNSSTASVAYFWAIVNHVSISSLDKRSVSLFCICCCCWNADTQLPISPLTWLGPRFFSSIPNCFFLHSFLIPSYRGIINCLDYWAVISVKDMLHVTFGFGRSHCSCVWGSDGSSASSVVADISVVLISSAEIPV